MDNIARKHLIKKKKKLLKFLNLVSSLDETSIKFEGDQNDDFFKKIKLSLEEANSSKKKLSNWIVKLEGLSGRKYRTLINNLIEKIEKPSYLEIGSWIGSTACAASYSNKLRITCIDNWSENFVLRYNPRIEFKKNLKKCINKESIFNLIEMDFKKIDYTKIGKFNIYMYDGPHHGKDHYDAIKLVQPALMDKYILIVDDWNWDQVRKGTNQAISELNLKIISKLEIRTTKDGSNALISGENSDWHQGYSFFVIKK